MTPEKPQSKRMVPFFASQDPRIALLILFKGKNWQHVVDTLHGHAGHTPGLRDIRTQHETSLGMHGRGKAMEGALNARAIPEAIEMVG